MIRVLRAFGLRESRTEGITLHDAKPLDVTSIRIPQ